MEKIHEKAKILLITMLLGNVFEKEDTDLS
jgi:hypothetical protein